MRKKPKKLILFANGHLNILKLEENDSDGLGEDGKMKQDRIVDYILFACDGGDF